MIKHLFLSVLLFVAVPTALGEESVFLESVPSDFRPPAPESDYDSQLLDQINEVGWYNLHVAEENGHPAFSFSLGHFHKQDHPEIIIIGLPAATAHQLLNIAVIKIVGAKDSKDA